MAFTPTQRKVQGMVDIANEQVLTLAEAAARCPGRPNLSTVWRWCLRGARGVKLESFMRGGRRFTTAQSLDRFIEACNATPCLPTVMTATRRREIAAAEQFCQTAGI